MRLRLERRAESDDTVTLSAQTLFGAIRSGFPEQRAPAPC
jgi:hypothetical protein